MVGNKQTKLYVQHSLKTKKTFKRTWAVGISILPTELEIKQYPINSVLQVPQLSNLMCTNTQYITKIQNKKQSC